jgi:hypothetical protein
MAQGVDLAEPSKLTLKRKRIHLCQFFFFMHTLKSSNSEHTAPPRSSWASQQAVAILAVDDIRISPAGLVLMRALDAGTMTHSEAIQSIKKRAAKYANQPA